MNIHNEEYKKACTEVLELLKYINEQEYNKIPQSVIENLKANCDKNYNYKIDSKKSFKNIEMLEITKAIIANLYTDYLISPEEKKEIVKQENLKRYNIEIKKRNKYNPDNIFKKDIEN